MDVKFVTGSINLGSKKTMNDIFNDVVGMKKSASQSQNVVKTSKVDDEEKCEECGKCPCECEETKDCMAEAKVEVKAEAKKEAKKEVKAEAKKEIKKEVKKVVAEDKNSKFVKIAKLNQENKTFLREFWLNVYPAEYVEAMLADK